MKAGGQDEVLGMNTRCEMFFYIWCIFGAYVCARFVWAGKVRHINKKIPRD